MANIKRLSILLILFLNSYSSFANDEYEGMKCNPDGNQSEVNTCAYIDYRNADKEINEAYKNLLSKLSLKDQKILRKDQREWLRQVDPSCREGAAGELGGSIWPYEFYSCMAMQTEGRTRVLQRWKEWH